MTALTPQQMRAIADELGNVEFDAAAALRAAADQLEAVHTYAIGVRLRDESISAELVALVTTGSASLTADTATQEATR